MVEEIPRIKNAVAQKFVDRPMKRVRAVGSDDIDLSTGPFAVFRPIGICDDRKFPDRINTQQLAAFTPPGVLLTSEALVYSTPLSRKRFSCGLRPDTANIFPTTEFEVPIPPDRCDV